MLDIQEDDDFGYFPEGAALTPTNRSLMTGHDSTSTSPAVVSTSAAPATDQLERCGSWLSSIPRDDVVALSQTQEYIDFLRVFERLGHAHRRVISTSNGSGNKHDNRAPTPVTAMTPFFQQFSISNDFFQHLTADDVIFRVFEFLECRSLIKVALTCSRFKQLAYKSAAQRTCDVTSTRQLSSVMQLLRAKEQIDGVGIGIHDNHVQVPMLLLNRRIVITNSGDPEYNGVYYCTGCNGNGFVFTKPRFPERRTQQIPSAERMMQLNQGVAMEQVQAEMGAEREHGRQQQAGRLVAPAGGVPPRAGPVQEGPNYRHIDGVAQPGQLLRCIIAKRFSNETILWYLSKEVEPSEEEHAAAVVVGEGGMSQVFSFWSKLMVIGDAPPDLCQYPSQSSIMEDHDEGWLNLSTNRNMQPPTVELL